MDDVLGYAGRRVIVSGAESGIGAATATLLVELGAEVHALAMRRPKVRGIASYTEADPRDPVELDAAAERIGRVLNALFNCAMPDASSDVDAVVVSFAAARHLTERVATLMIEGSSIATATVGGPVAGNVDAALVDELLATPDAIAARRWYEQRAMREGAGAGLAAEAVAAYTARHSAEFAARGIRINAVDYGAHEAHPEAMAWTLVLFGSPRAACVTGANVRSSVVMGRN